MLSIRTRGKNGVYYIRGTVTLGDKHIEVKEFSSGTRDRDAASHLMAEHETKLRHRLMFGSAAIVAQGRIADAFESYLTKAKPPCASDVLRIGKLNGLIGDFSLREPKQAWEHFRRAYLTGHDPAGQDRYRAVFQAAINVHHELHDLPPLRIKAIPFDNERVRFLSKEDRDRLIAAYSPHIQAIITLLAFHGPRIQTALQLPWGVNGVDMKEGSARRSRSSSTTSNSAAICLASRRSRQQLSSARSSSICCSIDISASIILRKMKASPRGGTGRVKDREAAARAAMGVTIFRGESAASPTKNGGAPSSLRRRVPDRYHGKA